MSDDEQTIRVLRRAMATRVRGHHLDPEVAAPAMDRVGSDPRPTRRRSAEYVAIAACLVGVAAVALVYAVTRSHSRPVQEPPARPTCVGAVVTSALPVWARGGFSAGAYVIPHVTGADGQIIGVLFADPLRSPPAKGLNNKILWVAKDQGDGAPLVIRARLVGSDQSATRVVRGGPGPSIINLPAPGCWQLTLAWSGHRDTLVVPYVP